jgi:sugar phosphate isomerase/epimerase
VIERLSLNQATVKRATLAEAVALCVAEGITGIGLWRDRVEEIGVRAARELVAEAGLRVTSLCRGGFFTSPDWPADNLSALEQAAELRADVLVLVCGGIPGGGTDLAEARARVAAGLAALVPRAADMGVRLGIEPLHPIFAADRCVVSTLGQALDLAEPYPADTVGVVVDTYHVWWDPDLAGQLARAGDRIAAFQLCDWLVPVPADNLLGRGHLGDGRIDFPAIAALVAAAGYTGPIEVEIFNADVWDAPPAETVRTVRERFATVLR